MDTIELQRDCQAVSIPKGLRHTLPRGTSVRIVQQRPGSYTVSTAAHSMYRIESNDADALGLGASSSPVQSELSEQSILDTLKTVRDPELPVNIVDLGLIYSCAISSTPAGPSIAIRMAMTSPGCSMSDVLKSEVETKLSQLPGVAAVRVEIVFDPPWDPSRMSEEARLQTGMDLGAKRNLVQILPNSS